MQPGIYSPNTHICKSNTMYMHASFIGLACSSIHTQLYARERTHTYVGINWSIHAFIRTHYWPIYIYIYTHVRIHTINTFTTHYTCTLHVDLDTFTHKKRTSDIVSAISQIILFIDNNCIEVHVNMQAKFNIYHYFSKILTKFYILNNTTFNETYTTAKTVKHSTSILNINLDLRFACNLASCWRWCMFIYKFCSLL
jgi:hypothetical protein